VKSITSRDIVAVNLILCPASLNPYNRPGAIDLVQRDLAALEAQFATIRDASSDKVFYDFLLSIHPYSFAREFHERDTMTPALQSQLNATVAQPLGVEARTYSCASQHLDAGMFEHTCANALLAVFPRLCFQHDRCDSIEMEQMRKHQTRWPCAYNPDLSFVTGHRVRDSLLGLAFVQHFLRGVKCVKRSFRSLSLDQYRPQYQP
jgi:hypothetical protein